MFRVQKGLQRSAPGVRGWRAPRMYSSPSTPARPYPAAKESAARAKGRRKENRGFFTPEPSPLFIRRRVRREVYTSLKLLPGPLILRVHTHTHYTTHAGAHARCSYYTYVLSFCSLPPHFSPLIVVPDYKTRARKPPSFAPLSFPLLFALLAWVILLYTRARGDDGDV